MHKIPALRLRHTHDLPVDVPGVDPARPFTLEAWVRAAHLDGAARLFAEPGYQGTPVRLRPGAVAALPLDRLPTLGSVDLPDGVEAVFFTEASFRGTSWAIRDDEPTVPAEHATARSVVLVDRRHRKQDCVVLFDGADFTGQARLLRVGDAFTVPGTAPVLRRNPETGEMEEQAQPEPTWPQSAWVPPGVALELTQPTREGDEPQWALHGDQPSLARGYARLSARREAVLAANQPLHTRGEGGASAPVSGSMWPSAPPALDGLRVPAKAALLVTTAADFGGIPFILVGDHTDLSAAFGLAPASAALVEAPDGPDGVVALGRGDGVRAGRVLAPGAYDGLDAYTEHLVVPRGFRVLLGDPKAPSEILGPGTHTGHRSGRIAVERVVGILSRGGAVGLMVRRSAGKLRSGGDVLDMAGGRLRLEAWHHVAVTWDGTTQRHYLDGREVKDADVTLSAAQQSTGGGWVLGAQLRGALAQVRAWPSALDAKVLRAQRFVGATLDGAPVEVVGAGARAHEAPPDAVAVTATLPAAPEDTAGLRSIRGKVEAQHQIEMRAAEEEATALKQRAQERATARIRAARDEARRHAHFAGIQSVAFVRGSEVVRAAWRAEDSAFVGEQLRVGTERLMPSDMAWAVGEANSVEQEWLYIAASWPDHRIVRRGADGAEQVLVQNLESPPMAIAVDGRGNLDTVLTDAAADPVLIWIEDNGTMSSVALHGAGPFVPHGVAMRLPRGRPRAWDLALDASGDHRRLIWSNGWEIFEARYTDNALLDDVKVLVPHAASPFPVAVSVDPDGAVMWVDVEDGMVRVLRPGSAAVEDLYAAPNPARGLGFGLIKEPSGGDGEAHVVYWSSAEEQTLEVPVLDTPGRYIDLKHDETRPFGQQVRAVAVDHAIGARWEEFLVALLLDKRTEAPHHVDLGPFPTRDGIELRASIWINEPGLLFGFFINGTVDRTDWVSTEPIIRFVGSHFHGTGGSLPTKEWLDVRLIVSTETGAKIQLEVNGVRIASAPGWHQAESRLGETLLLRLPHSHGAALRPPASGYLRSLEVRSQGADAEILAAWRPDGSSGAIHLENPTQVALEQHDPSAGATALLVLRSPEDALVFEPVRLDLRKGWTVSAHFTWSGPGDDRASQSVYELATTEDEERIVCALDAEGKPYLRIRWAGQLLGWTQLEDTGRRIAASASTLVTWAISPSGELITYIDGAVAVRSQVRLPAEPRVFTGHRLGAPNPVQTHTGVRGALLHDNDALTRYTGFLGSVERFCAWNHFAPQAAQGFDQAPGPDPSWDRSLVTTRTRRRYLHAGRVDGTEPALALFPIDLDCGLVVETKLEAAHAHLAWAQSQVQAAEAHAAAVKAAALQAAREQVARAEGELKAAQDKATADVQAAQSDAKRKRDDTDRKKSAAATRAEQTRSQGAGQARQTRTDGDAQARSQEAAAAGEKQRKVGAAQRRLQDHRAQRDAKQREYDDR